MPPTITYQEANITLFGVTHRVPVSATADLVHNNMNGGSSPTENPPGFVSGTCPQHHQRGHLIGNALGGPGTNPNLVTLTEGTNHPIMFEFEDLVKKHVTTNRNVKYTYRVVAEYNQDAYSIDAATGKYGVLGNPYCLFPSPSNLLIYFSDPAGLNPLAHLLNQHNSINRALYIPNGVYKLHYGSQSHIANQCWASFVNTPSIKCHTCPSLRSTGAPGMFSKWHICHSCSLYFCSTCGANLFKPSGFLNYFLPAHLCPKCSQPMVLW